MTHGAPFLAAGKNGGEKARVDTHMPIHPSTFWFLDYLSIRTPFMAIH